jgi:hypothetical protein
LYGAASRVPANETAFPIATIIFDLMVHPATEDAADKGMIDWACECWNALKPFVEQAVYVNVLEDALEEESSCPGRREDAKALSKSAGTISP